MRENALADFYKGVNFDLIESRVFFSRAAMPPCVSVENKDGEARVSVKRWQCYHHQYVSRSYVLDPIRTIHAAARTHAHVHAYTHAHTHTRARAGRRLLHSALIICRLPFWRGHSGVRRRRSCFFSSFNPEAAVYTQRPSGPLESSGSRGGPFRRKVHLHFCAASI